MASKLDKRVYDLVSMIFDVKNMKSTLMELEFDLEKMPLGKLSKDTINEGFSVRGLLRAPTCELCNARTGSDRVWCCRLGGERVCRC